MKDSQEQLSLDPPEPSALVPLGSKQIAEDEARRRLEALARRQRCQDCGTVPVVAWADGEWHLRCGQCGTVGPPLRDTKPERQAEEEDIWVNYTKNHLALVRAHQIEGLILHAGERAPEVMEERVTRALSLYPTMVCVTESTWDPGRQEYVSKAPPANWKAALAYEAITYGLDPLAREIIWYMSGPFVTAKGYSRKARNHPRFGRLLTRPATKDEWELYGCAEGDLLWIAEAYYRGDDRIASIGYGRVRAAETKPTDAEKRALERGRKARPVVTNSQDIAQVRALRHACRDAFGLEFPSQPAMINSVALSVE